MVTAAQAAPWISGTSGMVPMPGLALNQEQIRNAGYNWWSGGAPPAGAAPVYSAPSSYSPPPAPFVGAPSVQQPVSNPSMATTAPSGLYLDQFGKPVTGPAPGGTSAEAYAAAAAQSWVQPTPVSKPLYSSGPTVAHVNPAQQDILNRLNAQLSSAQSAAQGGVPGATAAVNSLQKTLDTFKGKVGMPTTSSGAPISGQPGNYTFSSGTKNPLNSAAAGGIDMTTLSKTLSDLNASQTAAFKSSMDKNAAALHDLVLKSSPELNSLSSYLKERMDSGLSPTELTDYQNAYRDSASAGGWGNYATSADIPGQEAGYITRIQEQARQAILPQLQSVGQSILGMTGFQAAPQVGAASVLSFYQGQQQAAIQASQFQQQFMLQQAQFEAEFTAQQQQSAFAMLQYNQQQQRLDEFEKSLAVQKGQDAQRTAAQYSPIALPGNPYSANKPLAGNPNTFFSNSWELDPNVFALR